MMNVFIELYLDEDVSVQVAELVQARGFTALTARAAGQLHASVLTNWRMQSVTAGRS